jgi:hypothetical protein
MEEGIEQYCKCSNDKALFTVTHLFGWYDGPTSGVARLIDSDQCYYFRTTAIDFSTGLRIYVILRIQPWTEKLQALSQNPDLSLFFAEIDQYVHAFSGKKFLFKAESIDAPRFELIENESTDLSPLKSFEDVANQDEEETQKWFELFG